jgi:hypothetical protein
MENRKTKASRRNPTLRFLMATFSRGGSLDLATLTGHVFKRIAGGLLDGLQSFFGFRFDSLDGLLDHVGVRTGYALSGPVLEFVQLGTGFRKQVFCLFVGIGRDLFGLILQFRAHLLNLLLGFIVDPIDFCLLLIWFFILVSRALISCLILSSSL